LEHEVPLWLAELPPTHLGRSLDRRRNLARPCIRERPTRLRIAVSSNGSAIIAVLRQNITHNIQLGLNFNADGFMFLKYFGSKPFVRISSFQLLHLSVLNVFWGNSISIRSKMAP
jgi:hypothetical protein